MDWGYHAFLIPEFDDYGIETGRTMLLSRLLLADNLPSPNPPSFLTRRDVMREVSRRGANSVEVTSQIKLVVTLQNDGALPLPLTRVDLLDVSAKDTVIARFRTDSFTVFGQQELPITFSHYIKPNEPLPDSLQFILRWEFEGMEQKIRSQTNLTYIRSDHAWVIHGTRLAELH
ncbi:hypothetical protein [Longimicrobium sp.]|jgi:hypothetical protein|uniref:hypothetical protein n=1 Tax=Longimicrobium sp. TaxID=2029185 RepID=UPI002EDB1BA5